MSVTWRARNITSDQIMTTYKGHELIVYPARRFFWGAIVDGRVWEIDGAPAHWPSEAGAMVASMEIADKMGQPRSLRVIDMGHGL